MSLSHSHHHSASSSRGDGLQLKDPMSQECLQQVAGMVDEWRSNPHSELELRHHCNMSKRREYENGTDSNFDHLSTIMYKMNGGPVQEVKTIDISYGDSDIRETIDDQNRSEFWVKSHLGNTTMNYWVDGFHMCNMRVALASEKPLSPSSLQDISLAGKSRFYRIKYRQTVSHKNRFKYELTRTLEGSSMEAANNAKPKYEFEIELIHSEEWEKLKPPVVVAEYLLMAAAESVKYVANIRRTFCVGNGPLVVFPIAKMQFNHPPRRENIYEFRCRLSKNSDDLVVVAEQNGVSELELKTLDGIHNAKGKASFVADCYYDIATSKWQVRKLSPGSKADTVETLVRCLKARLYR
eukprot:144448_1